MTPSLMPAEPDDWHMLDPSPASVAFVNVIVIVIVLLSACWTRAVGAKKPQNTPKSEAVSFQPHDMDPPAHKL